MTGRGRHAPSAGQPFGTLAATAALPTPPPPRRPAPTTTATTRSQGDATAAPICSQPACHVTGGRQSDRVTVSTPAPGCENHNIIRSSLSRCNSPSQPPPPTSTSSTKMQCLMFKMQWFNFQMFPIWAALYQSAAAAS